MTKTSRAKGPANNGAKKVFTAEDARTALLKKLNAGGAKGAASLWTAATKGAKLEVLQGQLEEMLAREEVFADRSAAKAKYFLWALRPKLPTAEEIGAKFVELAKSRFPFLTSPQEFAKVQKWTPAEKALLPEAAEAMVTTGRLLSVLLRSGKNDKSLYLATECLPAGQAATLDPESSSAPEPASPAHDHSDDLRAAYETLRRRTGFPAVPLAEWQREANLPLPAFHDWLRAEHAAGRVILSTGDWSIADDARRAAALSIGGETYLLGRLA